MVLCHCSHCNDGCRMMFSATSLHQEDSLPKTNGDAPSCNILLSCVLAVVAAVAVVFIGLQHALAKHGKTT